MLWGDERGKKESRRREAEEELMIKLVNKGKLSPQEGADELKITLDRFNDLMEKYSKENEKHEDELD